VQESLTNVNRYAKATHVCVRMRLDRNELRLVVQDDGCGMTKSARTEKTAFGVGILGMRERLQQLGGRLEIRTGRWGTRVVAILPHVTGQSDQEPSSVNMIVAAMDVVLPSEAGNRILIVDDHELIRKGVRELIEQEQDLEVCGEAANVREAIEQL